MWETKNTQKSFCLDHYSQFFNLLWQRIWNVLLIQPTKVKKRQKAGSEVNHLTSHWACNHYSPTAFTSPRRALILADLSSCQPHLNVLPQAPFKSLRSSSLHPPDSFLHSSLSSSCSLALPFSVSSPGHSNCLALPNEPTNCASS